MPANSSGFHPGFHSLILNQWCCQWILHWIALVQCRNCTILACGSLTRCSDSDAESPRCLKTRFAWSSDFRRQSWIWFGCTSNCSASSGIVLSPLRIVRATFALILGEWFPRFLFIFCSCFHYSYLRRRHLNFPQPCLAIGVHLCI